MRTLIIGDLHGCSAELNDMLAKFAFVRGKDRLICVGDAINKGPDSLGVLQTLHDLKAQAVLGNHEARFLDIWHLPSAKRRPKDNLRMAAHPDPEQVVHYIKDWPLWLELPQMQTPQGLVDITVVHAGLEPGKNSLRAMNPRCLLAIRTWDGVGDNLKNPDNPPWHQLVQWPGLVVFGHWAVQGLYRAPGFLGLDSGCVYGRELSAWCVEEDKIYQVPSRQPQKFFE